jgi:1-deoxy-D-xylulose 5-phosphate reductoisomerase
MKTALLVLGILLLALGIQDGIRILVDNQHNGIFGWMPGGYTAHLALDVILASGGAMLAKYASPSKSKE